MAAILKNSSDCLAEIKKTRASVKTAEKSGKCDCEKWRKNAENTLKFIKTNQSKMEALLQGNRDSCPPDIG